MSVLDTVVNSVLVKSQKKLIMASLKANAFMAWAFANNRVETELTGRNIANPLIVGRNQHVGAVEYYDSAPIGQTDEFDTINYLWSRVVGTMIISDQEIDENRGDGQIFDLMKAKMKVLRESIKEKFSVYLYGSGAGLDPNGLSLLVPLDPTTGTVGDISQASELQWRTSSYSFSGTIDSTNIEEVLDDVLMDLTMDGDKPNLILMGRNLYRTYRQAVRDKIVINLSESNSGKKMMDLGFAGVRHQGTTILYDEDCPVDRAYVLNDEYVKLHMLKGRNMSTKQLNAPWDKDVMGRRITWQGQFCRWRAYRTHAVIDNAS